MKYNVWYIQNYQDETQESVRASITFDTRDQAMARYYSELAQVGTVPETLASVAAMVFDDNGSIVAYTKEYSGYVKPEPEPGPEPEEPEEP